MQRKFMKKVKGEFMKKKQELCLQNKGLNLDKQTAGLLNIIQYKMKNSSSPAEQNTLAQEPTVACMWGASNGNSEGQTSSSCSLLSATAWLHICLISAVKGTAAKRERARERQEERERGQDHATHPQNSAKIA